MSDSLLTALSFNSSPSPLDVLYSVDVSDTTDTVSGSAKQLSLSTLAGFLSGYFDGSGLAGLAATSGINAANSAQSYALDRAHHTGTQSYTTIVGLGTAATLDFGFNSGNLVQITNSGALPNLNGNYLNRKPITIPFNTGLTPSMTGGSLQRCTLTGNTTLRSPLAATDGDRLELWFNASGGSRTLTLGTGFKIPTSSSSTGLFTIPTNTKSKFLFEYDGVFSGGQWELTSFISGY